MMRTFLKHFVAVGLLLALSGVAHAQTVVTRRVTWDLEAVVGHSAGPFSLNFQLVDGIGTGDGNASVQVTSSDFGGFTLTDTQFFSQVNRSIFPVMGTPLQFDVTVQYAADPGPVPDQFSFALLDSSGFELPTLGPADASATFDLAESGLLVNTYAGDLSRTPAAGGMAVALAAPIVLDVSDAPAVPEPVSWWLFLPALCLVGSHMHRARRRRSGVSHLEAAQTRP